MNCQCDSWVVETHVHYPTDINLLFDAMRKVIELMAKEEGISGWRQSKWWIRKIKKLMARAQKMKRSSSKDPQKKQAHEKKISRAHKRYIREARRIIKKAQSSLGRMSEESSRDNKKTLTRIDSFIAHARRQISQIERRVIHGETIAHTEKVFSIFEPYTEWIVKGKAGVRQELGLRVSLLKDQLGFILHHKIMQRQTDDKVAVEMVVVAKEKFPDISSCSFDKGYYTPANKKELAQILDKVIMPKKGRLTKSDKEEEYAEEFIKARRKHAGVESAINAMENHGLDRCPDSGYEAYERYVALAVVARNLQQLGNLIMQKKRARKKRREKYNKTRAARLKASA